MILYLCFLLTNRRMHDVKICSQEIFREDTWRRAGPVMLNTREKRVHWPVASTLTASFWCAQRHTGPRERRETEAPYLLHNRAGEWTRRPVHNPENGPHWNYGVFARHVGPDGGKKRTRGREEHDETRKHSKSLTFRQIRKNKIKRLC